MIDYGEMPTPPRKPEPPPRKCANCIFKGDDGLCYRRGFSVAEAQAAAFVPRPCFANNSCFYHHYRPEYWPQQGQRQ